ncbi:MAG: aldose 1-epimerase family protein [Atopostipes suicloacalis]|nr:aldose 1-epimerase family protein [Atopostipes suicloacalis]
MWQADKEYWARHAPVLFPIIGRLKDHKYEYKGKTYKMSQHGFARDRVFKLEESSANFALFSLTYDDESLKMYPFKFKLYIRYLLNGNRLTVDYEVINLSKTEVMYYSIGGHPAFNVSQKNINENLDFDEAYLGIHPDRPYKKIPISKEGYVQLHKIEQEKIKSHKLAHEDFKDDALVYEILDQSEVVLRDEAENVEIRLKPNRMNFLGIWTPFPKKAPFVCIEPWTGFADAEKTTGKLKEKNEISFLDKNERMNHEYTITFLKEKKIQSIQRWDQ